MLHKTDSLLASDHLLRMIRADRRLRHIDALIKPFINNEEHGYSIDIIKPNLKLSLSFALDKSGQIVIYTDKNLKNKKLFDSDCYESAKNYIIDTIINLLKQDEKKILYSKYDAL